MVSTGLILDICELDPPCKPHPTIKSSKVTNINSLLITSIIYIISDPVVTIDWLVILGLDVSVRKDITDEGGLYK